MIKRTMPRSTALLALLPLLVVLGCTSTTPAPGPSPRPTDAPAPAATPRPPATTTPLWDAAGPELTGNWLGVVVLPEQERARTLRAFIAEDAGRLKARLSFQFDRRIAIVDDVPITTVERGTSPGGVTLTFTAELEETGRLDFSGELSATGIYGAASDGQFWLIKPHAIEDWSPYTGAFRLEDGRVINISQSPGYGSVMFLEEGLWFTDYATGDYRALIPVAEDTFLVGAALGLAMPATAVIQFVNRSGERYPSLLWQPLDETLAPASGALRAGRLDFLSEDVTFESEGVTLAGTLTLPPGEGPFPAIVLVHGSGRTTRGTMGRQVFFLASEGFAVLAYDKRGVGESGGAYSESATESRLLLLSKDAAAGVSFLRSHPSIGDQPIGLYGGSQAGWIIPAAAAGSADVNFVVILSGPVVTVTQEGIYSDITGDGLNELTLNDEEITSFLERGSASGFDPIPYIEQLEIPALWLWGGRDLSVPVPASRDNLEAIIARDGKENFEYILFPNGDHALWESQSGRISDWPYITQTVPGLHDTIRRWLAAQVGEG